MIVKYLGKNEQFAKYQQHIYAYRISQLDPDDPDLSSEENVLEEYEEGTLLIGSGEKLLHLLRKFSKLKQRRIYFLGVENVLLIIGIQLKHPSMNFFPQKFYYIVDKAKELLNTLYDKVLE